MHSVKLRFLCEMVHSAICNFHFAILTVLTPNYIYIYIRIRWTAISNVSNYYINLMSYWDFVKWPPYGWNISQNGQRKNNCVYLLNTFIFRCNIYLGWVPRPALSFQEEFQCIGKEMSELGANTPKTIIFCRYVLKMVILQANVHFIGLKRESYGYMTQCCTSFWVTVHSLVTPRGVISVEHSLRQLLVAWQQQIITPTNAHTIPLQSRHVSIISLL